MSYNKSYQKTESHWRNSQPTAQSQRQVRTNYRLVDNAHSNCQGWRQSSTTGASNNQNQNKSHITVAQVAIDMENGGITFGHARSSELIRNFAHNIPKFLHQEGYQNVNYIHIFISTNLKSFSSSYLNDKDKRYWQPVFSDLDDKNGNLKYHYDKNQQGDIDNYGEVSVIDLKTKQNYINDFFKEVEEETKNIYNNIYHKNVRVKIVYKNTRNNIKGSADEALVNYLEDQMFERNNSDNRMAVIVTGDGNDHFNEIRNKLIEKKLYTIWITGNEEGCNKNNVQKSEYYSFYEMIYGLCLFNRADRFQSLCSDWSIAFSILKTYRHFNKDDLKIVEDDKVKWAVNQINHINMIFKNQKIDLKRIRSFPIKRVSCRYFIYFYKNAQKKHNEQVIQYNNNTLNFPQVVESW